MTNCSFGVLTLLYQWYVERADTIYKRYGGFGQKAITVTSSLHELCFISNWPGRKKTQLRSSQGRPWAVMECSPDLQTENQPVPFLPLDNCATSAALGLFEPSVVFLVIENKNTSGQQSSIIWLRVCMLEPASLNLISGFALH